MCFVCFSNGSCPHSSFGAFGRQIEAIRPCLVEAGDELLKRGGRCRLPGDHLVFAWITAYHYLVSQNKYSQPYNIVRIFPKGL